MTETFKKLKKKHLLIAIMKSIIVGVFSALFAVGTVMLGIKLGAVWIPSYSYVIIALGVFAIAGGITILLIYPTNKSLSKLLDSEYGLDEKVQTMVEFSEQTGDMLKIQREDTEQRLKNLPKKRISFAKIWQYVLIALLGISMILAGAIVPSRYEAPDVPNGNDYVLSEWDSKLLDQLISEVKSSDLKDEVMIPTICALEALKEELANVRTNTAMREVVRDCATAIDQAVILANTYRDIAKRMNTDTMDAYIKLEELIKAFVNAGDSYKKGADGTEIEITSMSMVKTYSQTSEEKIRSELGAFTDAFSSKVDKMTENIDIYNAIMDIIGPMNEILVEDGVPIETLADDSLYLALSDFSTILGYDIEAYVWRDDLKSTVSKACTDFLSSASKAMVEQVYNRMMDDFIFNTLEDIFGFALTQEELELPGISDTPSGPDDGSSGGGGLGDGEADLGSNDLVYDPNTANQRPYGEIWNSYLAKLEERINGEESELSEEMQAYIGRYIGILQGNLNTEGN